MGVAKIILLTYAVNMNRDSRGELRLFLHRIKAYMMQ